MRFGRKASPVIIRQQGKSLISVSWNCAGTLLVPADLELNLRLPCNGTREIPEYAGARNRLLRSDAVSRARRPDQVEAPTGLGQRESKSGTARLRRRKGQPREPRSRREP